MIVRRVQCLSFMQLCIQSVLQMQWHGCRAVVGELDEDRESEMDVTLIRAPPLRPVAH